MGLRFTVLSSGSTGNATLVANGEKKVLIDAGFSAKKLEQLMEERDISGHDLDAILVTHEHSDHIKGLGPIARKYNLPVYANEKTWEALEKQIGAIAEENKRVMETGSSMDLGTMKIESFGISHDAAEPVAYNFYEGEQKLSVATDLGYLSPKVKESVADADVLVLESNHDVEMLRMGRYPWNIKRRILSDLGHLSNDAAGEGLCELLGGRTKRVYLAHLSRNHNMTDLARLTVGNILEDNRITCQDHSYKLMDTYYDRPTEWDSLDED
ncbi:MBL fold metallo-hydrolase [Paenibacillus aurantius]|uniref:MBL fold metallo-hydrolase n=1 Tax=Paenibacillus aurantius TaxID=2918900 RepID=A0AA96RHU2_9BACL|nr:MBL fold metallo-hydrolase [Paenibacillus aurantius]WNQ11474.1 MBL fold metallo-hydrolase [Paenibacillus aurantius]